MSPGEALSEDLPEGSLGRLLVEEGLVTRAQLEYALRLQSQPPFPRLGETVVAEGWASEEAVRDLLERQGKALVACASCGGRFNLEGSLDGLVRRRCPRCGGELAAGRGLAVEESTDGLEPVPTGAAAGLGGEVEAALADPSRRCGPYVLLSELGAGRLGPTWRAWDTELRRPVALKLLRPMDAGARELLEEHAEAAARLRHPHAAAVLGWGEARLGEEEEPHLYLASTFAPGVPVALLPEPLPAADGVRAVAAAAHALGHAHAAGVIHGRLTASDLVVDEGGEVRLVDLGLAAVAGRVAPGAEVPEAAAYQPPERTRGHGPPDPRGDVYALGAILYRILTGRPPFAGALPDVLAAGAREAAPAPAGLPPEVAAVVARCLAKDPAARFPDAAALAHALDDLAARLEDEPRPVERSGATTALLILLLGGGALILALTLLG